jgi:hypothetical protein
MIYLHSKYKIQYQEGIDVFDPDLHTSTGVSGYRDRTTNRFEIKHEFKNKTKPDGSEGTESDSNQDDVDTNLEIQAE